MRRLREEIAQMTASKAVEDKGELCYRLEMKF